MATTTSKEVPLLNVAVRPDTFEAIEKIKRATGTSKTRVLAMLIELYDNATGPARERAAQASREKFIDNRERVRA